MTSLLLTLLLETDRPRPIPEDEEVVAGWGAFGIFLLMALAVALLAWSLARQLRKVRRNRESGVFGDEGRPEATERSDAEDEQTQG